MPKELKYNLFLDDNREPSGAYSYTKDPVYKDLHWIVVVNYEQFVDTIERYYDLRGVLPVNVSFDHDLADEHYDYTADIPYDDMTEKTGFHCAKWLVDFCIDNDMELPTYYAHSMNTVGRENIIKYLNNYVKFVKENK